MKQILSALALLALSQNSLASRTLTQVEAVVDQAQFDGQTYRYRLTAYQTQHIAWVHVVTECETGQVKGRRSLRAVRIRLMVSAEFNRHSQVAVQFGEVDVRGAIRKCLAETGQTRELIPIQVKLPEISVSSFN